MIHLNFTDLSADILTRQDRSSVSQIGRATLCRSGKIPNVCLDQIHCSVRSGLRRPASVHGQTHIPAQSNPVEIWQQANEDRLQRNAQRWAGSRETTLYTEEWGKYYVAVTREGQRLVLWMLDTESANTDWIQSAMNLRAPLRLQSSYTQAMILALIWQPFPRSVFLSGLGGGCLATTLHHHLTGASFVCVEIAAPVVTAATRYFGCQPDDRLSIIVSDVRDFLRPGQVDHMT